jgi:hypothetical protein
MDMMTLAMAKPKIIDLTEYRALYSNTECTFNELCLALLQDSVQNGGTVSTMTVTDMDGALCKAITTTRYVEFVVTLAKEYTNETVINKTYFPTSKTISKTWNKALAASTQTIVYVEGMNVKVEVMMRFGNLGVDDVDIFVKATPFV